MDYAMPRRPAIFRTSACSFHNVPCGTNVGSVIKGRGRGGTVGRARRDHERRHRRAHAARHYRLDMPATPQRLWAAIQKAKSH